MEERLQKILAHAGIASRRRAEKIILEGRVAVNGHIVNELGVRADARADVITVDGKRLRQPSQPLYILLNKPPKVLSTREDPAGRPTVVDLVGARMRDRIYPVGRLDFASEGLLILTNDGEFTRFMTRAGVAGKTYHVKVSGEPSETALDRLRRGMKLDGSRSAPCEVKAIRTGNNSWYEVTLHQGRNRQIRRMFEAIGHPVMKLRRIRIGFLEDSQLRPGSWRHLTSSEVKQFYGRYGKRAPVQKTQHPPKGERSATRGKA
jgi:23S rRNA pseudouridine2605 synthase